MRFCLKSGANPSLMSAGTTPALVAAQDGAVDVLYALLQVKAPSRCSNMVTPCMRTLSLMCMA